MSQMAMGASSLRLTSQVFFHFAELQSLSYLSLESIEELLLGASVFDLPHARSQRRIWAFGRAPQLADGTCHYIPGPSH
jgi:hypothetical protein